MAHNFQVLSFGYDRNLMASRSLLLRDSGFVVHEAFSRYQALSLTRSDLIDVLLICHTVPDNEAQVLVSAMRKQRLLIPILCIRETDYWASSRNGCIVASSTPQELLAAIRAAVKGTPGLRRGIGRQGNLMSQ